MANQEATQPQNEWENQPSVKELENLLISHEMMLVIMETLKIEDEEKAMSSKGSKSK